MASGLLNELETSAPGLTAPSSAAGALRVAVDDLKDVFGSPVGSLCEDWRKLFESDSQAPLALHPGFVETEFAALPRDTHAGFLLRCHRDSDLAALAVLMPKLLSTRAAGGVGPAWALRGYRLAGNALLGTCGADVQSALVDGIAAQLVRQRAEFLLIEDLEETSPLMPLFQKLRGRGFLLDFPSGFQERLCIRLPERAEEFWGGISSSVRSTARRKEKKIGSHRMERITDLSQVADFLGHAHQISLNTWQSAQLGLRVRNDADDVRLFHFLADHGALRSYLLWVDERPIAFLIGTQFQGRFHYEEVGFDRDFSHLSPGYVLLTKTFADLFAWNRPAWFDFGFGDADYKRQFANFISRSSKTWLVPPGWKGRRTVGYLRSCRAARRWGRSLLARSGWLTRLRQRLRRKPVRVASPTSASEG